MHSIKLKITQLKKSKKSLMTVRQRPSNFNIITKCGKDCRSKAKRKTSMGLFCINIHGNIISFFINGHNINCFKRIPSNVFPFPFCGKVAYEFVNLSKEYFEKIFYSQRKKYGLFNNNVIEDYCSHYCFSCNKVIFVSDTFMGTSDDSDLICNKCL